MMLMGQALGVTSLACTILLVGAVRTMGWSSGGKDRPHLLLPPLTVCVAHGCPVQCSVLVIQCLLLAACVCIRGCS